MGRSAVSEAIPAERMFVSSFGRGSSASPKNILATLVDMWRIYRNIFSDEYELPVGRRRTWRTIESSSS